MRGVFDRTTVRKSCHVAMSAQDEGRLPVAMDDDMLLATLIRVEASDNLA